MRPTVVMGLEVPALALVTQMPVFDGLSLEYRQKFVCVFIEAYSLGFFGKMRTVFASTKCGVGLMMSHQSDSGRQSWKKPMKLPISQHPMSPMMRYRPTYQGLECLTRRRLRAADVLMKIMAKPKMEMARMDSMMAFTACSREIILCVVIIAGRSIPYEATVHT